MFYMLISQRWSYTDGEAVIMLAFQASGRGSTPLQCKTFLCIFLVPFDLVRMSEFQSIIDTILSDVSNSYVL